MLPNPRFPIAIEQRMIALLQELHSCEIRLGTAAEQHDDYARACDLAHAVKNCLTVVRLTAELRNLKPAG